MVEFAANNAVLETIGVSPFFANYSFYLKLGVKPNKLYSLTLSLTQKR